MYKTLLLSSTLAGALIALGCSQTEQALTEETETAPVNQPIAQTQSVQHTTAQTIEVAHDDRNKMSAPVSKPDTQKVSAPSPTQTAARVMGSQPDITLDPNPIKRTPFPVKRCINLGNALEAPNEGEWGYTIRKRDLQSIKQAGFDTIRLPVRWDTHTANRAPYQIDASFMARVQTVVRQAQSLGLGVIIDVHHFEKLMSQPKRQEARFLAIWTQIAEAFKDAPTTVYFEVLNEPTLEINMAQVNALYAKVIPIIRTAHPSRKIIIGGNSWNSVESLADVSWPDDPNIIATFHDYGPHAFTHQGAEWSEPAMPMGRLWGGREDANELKSTYDIANGFRRKTGLPILVGEFGVIDKVPQAQRMQWTKIRRQTMEANNMAWCVWDFSGAFKSYDARSEQWLPGVQDALFGPQ